MEKRTLEFEVVENCGISDFVMVYGHPFNDYDWGYWLRKDAFYVEYVKADGTSIFLNYEPADSAHIDLIPDSDDQEACATFAIGLIESDIKDQESVL